jgi:heterodisulfide reductase subunit C
MLAAKRKCSGQCEAKIQQVPNKKEREPYIANSMHMCSDLGTCTGSCPGYSISSGAQYVILKIYFSYIQV